MNVTHGTLSIPNDPTPWVIVSPNDDKAWCVLWLQGWTSTIEDHLEGITRMAETSGVTFAMMNYAGHGDHPTPLADSTKKQQFTECLAAYDKLVSMGYEKIIVIGGSFGGYMAALLTGQRTPTATVLRAPAVYRDEEFEIACSQTLRWDEESDADAQFRAQITAESELDAITAIRNYTGTIWVTEHELDTVVPRNIPKAYFDAAKHGNYLLVPNTEHSPKTMANPQKHFKYIEHMLVSIIRATQLTP